MSKQHRPPQRIIIVGGGSAGWMAASLIQHAWHHHNIQITLIESSDISTIGVGEGSTPYLRSFFRKLAIPESEWMPACNATYKCGISFADWLSETRSNSYFHPFFSPLDQQPGKAFFHNCDLRRCGHNASANPNEYFVSSILAKRGLAPIAGKALPFELDYGYHFDAALLGQFLKTRAIKLGIRHVIDKVVEVKRHANGDIASLVIETQGQLKGDFFIDCSGFAGILINKTLGEPFYPFNDNLFNNAAVAIPTPTEPEKPLPTETVSTALSHGWAWRIPLTNRFGNGYVYSSDFINSEDAEIQLRQFLGPTAQGYEARHLKMRVGRVNQHWRNNCLAVGLSQGFIEPLEATALMLIQITLEHFIGAYNRGGGQDGPHRQAYNQRINTFFEGIRDYIVTHYRLNRRTDSDYWQANREHNRVSDNLAVIMEAWDQGQDMQTALRARAQSVIYLEPSWYCILAGMNRFPPLTGQPPIGRKIAPLAPIHHYRQHLTKIFADHRDYLRAHSLNNTPP